MSWRDGFTEQMFVRLQHAIDFVCTQLHVKKSPKKNTNIDEVQSLDAPSRSKIVLCSGLGRASVSRQGAGDHATIDSENVLSEAATNDSENVNAIPSQRSDKSWLPCHCIRLSRDEMPVKIVVSRHSDAIAVPFFRRDLSDVCTCVCHISCATRIN